MIYPSISFTFRNRCLLIDFISEEEGGGGVGGGSELDAGKWIKLEMMKWGVKEWRRRSEGISPPKNHIGKVPKKMVNVKRISPRVIQQPR